MRLSAYCQQPGYWHLTLLLSVAIWLPQLAVISSYLAMPNNPKSDGSVMTVWLQVRAVSQQRLLPVNPLCFLHYGCSCAGPRWGRGSALWTTSVTFSLYSTVCSNMLLLIGSCTAASEVFIGPAGVCME